MRRAGSITPLVTPASGLGVLLGWMALISLLRAAPCGRDGLGVGRGVGDGLGAGRVGDGMAIVGDGGGLGGPLAVVVEQAASARKRTATRRTTRWEAIAGKDTRRGRRRRPGHPVAPGR